MFCLPSHLIPITPLGARWEDGGAPSLTHRLLLAALGPRLGSGRGTSPQNWSAGQGSGIPRSGRNKTPPATVGASQVLTRKPAKRGRDTVGAPGQQIRLRVQAPGVGRHLRPPAPPAWVSNRAPPALVFTSLLSSRLMLAGLKAATRRHPSSGWKLHSHRSEPRPREHSERRLHLDEKDQCPPVTLLGPLAVHGAGTPQS